MKYILTVLISITGVQVLYSQGYSSEKIFSWYEKIWKQYIDFFDNGTAGIILGCLIGVVALFIIWMIIYGIYYGVNYMGVQPQKGRGVIQNKEYTAAYTSHGLVPISNGQTTTYIPTTTHHPAEYSLEILIPSEHYSGWLSVNKKFYKIINEGDAVTVEYKTGRLNNKIKIVDTYI